MAELPVNVCVAVRVRPLLPGERLHSHQVCVKKVPKSKNQLIVGKDRSFTFDHLHWWNTKQQELFKTTIKPLVVTYFQGYNATVFAYGQTGSGKTYTIGGSNPANITREERGIIPRAVEDIFSEMKQPGRKHIEHSIKVSYVEIYKEEVRDLLEVDMQKCQDVHIREDKNGNTVIVGAKEEICITADEVLSLLQKGSALRHTGATQMNELSSRSHAIFSLHMIQTWPSTPRPKNENNSNSCSTEIFNMNGSGEIDDEELINLMSSKFHFVDLAGSERANRTGNTGERFKESVQINTGLLALGNVISALSDPKKKKIGHVPYRDSKITRVLKDSLGGNAHTVMITCISPSSTSFAETINALKYANRAKNITNKPVINRDPQQVLIEEMQDEIEELKQQLQSRPTTREVAMEKQKLLQQEVEDLQTECRSYKDQINEAARYFKVICSGKQIGKSYMKRWLDSVTKNDTFIQSLDVDGSKVLSEKDDKLLASKDAQIDQLGMALSEARDDVRDKEESLQISEEMKEQQSEKLIEQNVIIEQLQEEIMYLREEFNVQLQNAAHARYPAQGNTFNRAQSVPHPQRGTWFSTESRLVSEDAKRAHSSPPLISAERVMAGFRARNHVIADRIEEENEVDHKAFVTDDTDHYQEAMEDRGFLSDRSNGLRKLESFATHQQQWRIPTAKRLPDTSADQEMSENVDVDLNDLRESTIHSLRRLKESELRAQNSNNKIRELSINIRMKEELIKELVRTGSDAEAVNREYLGKIMQLQREVQTAKRELLEAHKVLQTQTASGRTDQEMQKLKAEYEQKLKVAKSKVQMLQKKQRETENIASIPTQNRKKIKELELGIATMRQMQEDMQKKLRLEKDRKRKLESAVTKDQAKIKELELKNKNQEKVLKRKTEEVAVIQRKLRSAKSGSRVSPENIDDQKQWLDDEIEKAIEQQNLLKQLEDALRAREAAVIRREEVLQQKEALETKKLRSSQVITSEVLQVASKLATVDQKLHARTQQLRNSSDRTLQGSSSRQQQLKSTVEHLQTEKSNLENKKKALENKLQDGHMLDPQDERELIELDEAVEALTAAIEWQDDTIVRTSTSADVRESRLKLARERNSSLQKHMKNLNGMAAGMLLTKCFERVIELRESEQALESRMNDLESKLSVRDQAVMESESALNRYVVESDRKLMEMEKKYEQRTQQLVKQLSDHDSVGTGTSLTQELQNRIEVLQKDLLHYRSSNRELKKKLKDVLMESGAEIPLSVRSNTETEIKTRQNRKSIREGSSSDGLALGSTPTSARVKASEKKYDHDAEAQSLPSPKRQPKRSIQNQLSVENINQEMDAPQPQSPKTNSNPNVFASLRRSRQEPPTTYASIPTNSVEYLEFQNLQSPSRVSSNGRRLNSGSELTNQPQNVASCNLISALSSEGLNMAGAKLASGASLPGFILDPVPDLTGSKAPKLDPAVTPVRVSKKDIKRISKNEVNQRKTSLSSLHDSRSNVASLSQSGLQDSLDANRNHR